MRERAAVYVRQSVDQVGLREAVGRQEADCRALAASRGWSVVAVFSDNDVSATARRRPGFEAMLRGVIDGDYDVVVVWHVDRLVRRMADLEPVLAACEAAGVLIATATGELDPATDAGRLVARILSSVAQAEVERKGVRQRRANLQRAQEGRQRLVRRPFGYDLQGRVIRREANALRFAATRVLAGASVAATARELNERSIRTSTGVLWRSSSLILVLRNPRYAGLLTYHGQPVARGGWTPLLSEQIHQRLVAVLDDPIRRARQDSRRRHLLSGIAQCGLCGRTVECNKDGRTGQRVYRCPLLHVSRNVGHVDTVVIDAIVQALSRPDAASVPPGLPVDAAGREAAKLAILNQRLAQTRVQRTRTQLAIDYADGLLDRSQLLAASEHLRRRERRVEADANRVVRGTTLARLAHAAATAHPQRAVQAAWNRLSVDDRRDVIRTLMTVTIAPAGRGTRFDPDQVVITWRSPQPGSRVRGRTRRATNSVNVAGRHDES